MRRATQRLDKLNKFYVVPPHGKHIVQGEAPASRSNVGIRSHATPRWGAGKCFVEPARPSFDPVGGLVKKP